MNTWVIAKHIEDGDIMLGSRISYQASPADPMEANSVYMFRGPKFCSALVYGGEQLEILETINSWDDIKSTAEKYGISLD